jgi:hypothetical protein
MPSANLKTAENAALVASDPKPEQLMIGRAIRRNRPEYACRDFFDPTAGPAVRVDLARESGYQQARTADEGLEI